MLGVVGRKVGGGAEPNSHGWHGNRSEAHRGPVMRRISRARAHTFSLRQTKRGVKFCEKHASTGDALCVNCMFCRTPAMGAAMEDGCVKE